MTDGTPMSHAGWFAVEEEAIRRIHATFDKPCDARNAVACYVMLCRKVNLKGGNHVFEDTIGSMARDLNSTYRDAQKALRLVEAVGMVKIERKKVPGTNENAPSTYTVIRLSGCNGTLERSVITHEGDGRDEARDLSRTIPKNTTKNFPKNTTKGEAAPRTRFVVPSKEQAEAEAVSLGMPADEGQAFIDHHAAKGWVIGRAPMKDWRAAMRTWHRNWQRFAPARSVRANPTSQSKTGRSIPDYEAAAREADQRSKRDSPIPGDEAIRPKLLN